MLMRVLNDRVLCSTCDVINLDVTRYSRIDLSAQKWVLDIDGVSKLKNNVSFGAKMVIKMAHYTYN